MSGDMAMHCLYNPPPTLTMTERCVLYDGKMKLIMRENNN